MTSEKGEATEQARIRDDALLALRDAREWSRTPAQWTGVTEILKTMGSGAGGGLDLGDPAQRKAVEKATVQLELAGPRRIDEVDRAAETVPPDVYERLNVLIEELSKPAGEKGAPGAKR